MKAITTIQVLITLGLSISSTLGAPTTELEPVTDLQKRSWHTGCRNDRQDCYQKLSCLNGQLIGDEGCKSACWCIWEYECPSLGGC
ncbi:hypothetical protein B0T14DRAFT_513603 [Immersiella caudata]|uniref:Uncharacterized protein n=1 Tax=Immersiella caudata TaxID=314043 RepID=A0AA40C7E5_9PEZI|nr:hypothetical protein B0T14DRAFT_513603 [Immersiella caudata]